MKIWLAECDQAKNWYAGKLAIRPLTSLISQARQTTDFDACQRWCNQRGGYTPKQVEINDDDLANSTD